MLISQSSHQDMCLVVMSHDIGDVGWFFFCVSIGYAFLVGYMASCARCVCLYMYKVLVYVLACVSGQALARTRMWYVCGWHRSADVTSVCACVSGRHQVPRLEGGDVLHVCQTNHRLSQSGSPNERVSDPPPETTLDSAPQYRKPGDSSPIWDGRWWDRWIIYCRHWDRYRTGVLDLARTAQAIR